MERKNPSLLSVINSEVELSSDTTTNGSLSRSSSMEQLPEGYVEEKFRVDRRKLEAMILGCLPDPWDSKIMKIPIASDGHVMSADDFFQTIMSMTNTEIRYPKFLKIGARNKKDPYVRVIGYPDAVQEASTKVRHDLQPHNKITMKLDVSWTCHSHIIGKSGNTIQPVVKKTGVSIHFPDGNKNSNEVKSNQVSINSRGEDLGGLEEARAAIRELTPLTFNFSLPANASFIIYNNCELSMFVERIHSTYNVKVEIQYKEGDQPVIYGSVKGTEWDAARVMEATILILQSLCNGVAHQISVQISMEISQQFHACITNRNSEILNKIMIATSTNIEFEYTNGPGKEKVQWCHMSISGSIHNVYSAKQKILGSLPLVVMFDLMPTQNLDDVELDQIMQTLDVQIVTKNKRMDGRRSIVLRGPERNASNIYEAWRLVTKSDKTLPRVKVPKSYFLSDGPSFLDYGQMYDSTPAYHMNNQHISPTNVSVPPGLTPHSPIVKEEPFQGAENSSGLVEQESDSFQFKDFGSILDLIPDRRAPGCEKKQIEATQLSETMDYYSKKMQAAKMMKQPVSQNPRTPTSSWSGLGFSKSLPQFALKLQKENEGRAWNGWNLEPSDQSYDCNNVDPRHNLPKVTINNEPMALNETKPPIQMSASSYMDSLMYRPIVSQEKVYSDLGFVLASLKLDRYTDLFDYNNITMDGFANLTENDLKSLGVDCFGHRQKMLLAIQSVKSGGTD